jgi:hypothetical protein
MALQIDGIVKVCSLRFGLRMLGVSPGNWSRVLSVMMAVSGVARSMILWLMGVGSSAANVGAMKSMSGCGSICFMMMSRVLCGIRCVMIVLNSLLRIRLLTLINFWTSSHLSFGDAGNGMIANFAPLSSRVQLDVSLLFFRGVAAWLHAFRKRALQICTPFFLSGQHAQQALALGDAGTRSFLVFGVLMLGW